MIAVALCGSGFLAAPARGLSYGVTDDLTVTVGALPPLGGAYTGWLTGKYRFLRAGRFSLAAHGSTALFHQPAYIDDFDDEVPAESEVFQTLGLAASYCIDSACRSVLGAYGGALVTAGAEDARFGLLGASAIVNLGGHVKLMVEADQGNQLDPAGDSAAGLFVWYGIRVAGPSIAVDLGVLDAIGGPVFDDGSISLARVPWFKFAYRAL